MKKLLLSGIAALSVLSASAAQAGYYNDWKCGHTLVQIGQFRPDVQNRPTFFIYELSFENPKTTTIRGFEEKNGIPYLNDKRCTEMSDEEWKAAHGE